MPDAPQGQDPTAEELQPASMPEAEQTTEVTSELPEDASERTKEQFEKLKQHNADLQDRLKALETSKPETSVFDEFRPLETPPAKMPEFSFPGIPQNQVNDTIANLVDENGYLDEKILKNTLSDLQKQIRDAKEEAANARKSYEQREESEQVKVTHSKYPQLDPKSSNFDRKFFERVKEKMIVQFINGKRNFLEAADSVAEDYPLKQVEKQDAQKKQDQVRQINATGSSSGRSAAPTKTSFDDDELVRRTRAGDSSALMERLAKAGL